MIEDLFTTIIKELGATGLLIVGLYFILERGSKRISARIKVINDEMGEIVKLLNCIVYKTKRNQDNENRGNANNTR